MTFAARRIWRDGRAHVRRAGALILALLTLGAADVRAQVDSATVKATFLYRFASFVEWPHAEANAPIVLCVEGSDAFARTLDTLVRTQRADGRAFATRRVAPGRSAGGCSILYLVSDEDVVRRALREASGAPVLTVTDADATPDVRGIIHFVLVDNRVRFHIDDARAADGGLSIDPRLLNLALTVRRRAVR